MDNESQKSTAPRMVIGYETIRDLAFFQEQYDRLTHEMQQVQVQLASSPPLEPGSPGAQKREEWRAWLQLQIKSKQRAREELLRGVQSKGIVVEQLPE